MNNKKLMSVLIKILIVAAGSLGIIAQATTVANRIAMLYFFTIQANLLCVVSFIFILFIDNHHFAHSDRQKESFSKYKFALSVSMLIVMFTYQLMLKPNSEYYQNLKGISIVYDLCLHYIVPILVILDWIIFDSKDCLSWKTPFWSLVFPFFYLGFVFIRANTGNPFFNGYRLSNYPYFFLDIETIGFIRVSFWIAALVVSLLTVGYLFIIINKLFVRLVNIDRSKRNIITN
jgi:hypothetical protein